MPHPLSKKKLLTSVSAIAFVVLGARGAFAAVGDDVPVGGGTESYIVKSSVNHTNGTVTNDDGDTNDTIAYTTADSNGHTLIISGGTVTSTNNKYAISTTSDTTGNLTVSGGSVTNLAGTNVIELTQNFGTISVSSGNITGLSGSVAIDMNGSGKTIAGINISGTGLVTTADSNTILINAATTITNGIVNSSSNGITSTGNGISINVGNTLTASSTDGVIYNNGGVISSANRAISISAGIINNSAGALINNTGTISATGERAIIVNSALTTYSGAAGLGGGILNSGTITSASTETIRINSLITNNSTTTGSAAIYNSGNITNTNEGYALNLQGTVGATTVTNVGTISSTGTGYGVTMQANLTGTFTNNGTITGATGGGIFVQNSSLTSRIVNGSGAVIQTTGALASGDYFGAINIGSGSGITSLENSGTIKDNTTGSAVYFHGAAQASSITNNSGATISSGTGDAIAFYGRAGGGGAQDLGGVVTITNNGTISSGATTNSFAAVHIYQADQSTGTLTNNGLISSSQSTSGGTIYIGATGKFGMITNTGTIQAGSSSLNAIDASASAVAGALKLTNSGTITGNIKTSTGGSNIINMNGGTINGNITQSSSDDTLVFYSSGSGTQTFAGTATYGTLTATAGTTTLSGLFTGITGGSVTVASGATVKFNGGQTVTGTQDYNINGNVTVAAGKSLARTTTGTTTIGSGGVVTIGVLNSSGTFTHGALSGGTGTNVINNASGLAISYASSGSSRVANNTVLRNVVTGTGGITWVNSSGTAFSSLGTVTADATGSVATTITGTGTKLTDDSYNLDFTAYRDATTPTTVDIVITLNGYNTSSTLANAKGVGSALDTIGNSGDDALDTIVATLDGYSTAAQVETALKTLTPNTAVNGSTTQAAVAVSDASTGTIEGRMEVAMNNTTSTGVATGGKMHNSGIWGDVFGSTIDQGLRKGVDGYQADIGGFAIGGDSLINNQTLIGAAFAYGYTDATGVGNKTEIGSYQGLIYGSYDMGKVYYEGLGAFTFNSYDTTRNLFDGSVAKGSFNGQQYSVKGTAGYKVDLQNGFKVTPFASAQYIFLTHDDYTETGSNANLHVKYDDINIFKTGLGTTLAYSITDNGYTYVPRVSTAWYYDLVGDEANTTSNFSSAASATFISKGASIAQSSFKLGTGLDVLAHDNITVSFDYNWETKQDFDAHTGELKARFDF